MVHSMDLASHYGIKLFAICAADHVAYDIRSLRNKSESGLTPLKRNCFMAI